MDDSLLQKLLLANLVSLSIRTKCVPQHWSQSAVMSTSIPFWMASGADFPNSHSH